jgi:hypothetical protein
MNKALYFTTVMLALVSFTGCIIPGARKERAEIELQRNDSLFAIDEGDFRFRMVLPKDLMIVHTPKITLHKDKNRLEISCGPSFNLEAEVCEPGVREMPTQMGVFSYNVLDDEDNSFVFSRHLPDGRIFDYGLTQYISMNESCYKFHSDDEGEYTLQDVLKMKTALASVKM